MSLNSKVDLAFRAKIHHLSDLIQKLTAKVESKSDSSPVNSKDNPEEHYALKVQIKELGQAREKMKKEFELAKITELSLQAKEALLKHDDFMKAVKAAKSKITKFEDITAIKVVRKKKKDPNPFNF